MKVVIVKYNAGNVQSVRHALDRLGLSYEVTDSHEAIQQADRVIFPGVGEANTTMAHLKARQLDRVLAGLQQPLLGICLGMQLLCRHSEENDTPCIGVFDETVRKFEPSSLLKVPHMGWNALADCSGWLPTRLSGRYVYFVHSYYVPVNAHTSAAATHGVTFSAAIRKNNFFAVQFHPEKSAEAGQQVLEAFFEQTAL